MRPLALAAALAALALLPLAPAKPLPPSTVEYAEASGTLLLGLPAGEVERVGPAEDPVNAASVTFEANDCHRDLRLRLHYDPASTGADAGAVAVGVRHEAEVELRNATTGEPLPDGLLRWSRPGTLSYPLEAGGPVEARLALRTGALVDYELRVTGWVDPSAECAWQGALFVNEVEVGPSPGEREWVEVLNLGFDEAALDGWTLRANGDVVHTFKPGDALPAGARLVVELAPNALPDAGSAVTLRAPRGWDVDETPALADEAADARAWQRAPDGANAWALASATRGSENVR